MNLFVEELLWVGIVPLSVALVAMLIARWIDAPRQAAWVVSLGLAIVVGQFGLDARSGMASAWTGITAPQEARDWLPCLVAIAAGLGLLAQSVPATACRWIVPVACLFAAVVPARLLAGSVYVTRQWSIAGKFAVLAIWTSWVVAVWLTLAAGGRCGQAGLRGGLLVVVAGGMAVIVTLSGSFTYGELAGVVAAVVAGAMLAEAIVARAASKATADGLSGAAGVLAVALGAILLLARYYAQLSNLNVLLLSVSVATAAGRMPTPWPRTPAARAVLRIAACLVPLSLAMATAWATMPATSSAY